MAFKLPDLPYSADALEPHITARTLEFHHGKHHAAYVDKLNGLVKGSDLEHLSLEEVVLATAGRSDQSAIFNNAAQAWNHAFYWNSMVPGGGGAPKGALASRIREDFGSFDTFREKFKSAATTFFGSGWAWLVLNGGQLQITTTDNAMSPIARGEHALLTCDVWEHAYYLDYQNRRPSYVDAFMTHLANWDFAEQRLAEAPSHASAA